MTKVSANVAGVNLDTGSEKQEFSLGVTVPVTGGTAIYAKASANINANTTNVTVSGAFAASAGGGDYKSPPGAVKSGEFAWFVKSL